MESAGGNTRSGWRLLKRRRGLPFTIRRFYVYADTRTASDLSLKCTRCEWLVAHGDPCGRSGVVSRAQASLSADLQQVSVSFRRFHGSLRQSENGSRRKRSLNHYLWCFSTTVAGCCQAGRAARHQRRSCRSAQSATLRLECDRGDCKEDKQSNRRSRRLAFLWLWRRDCCPHFIRTLRTPRRTCSSRGRAGHLCRLRSATRRRDPPASG